MADIDQICAAAREAALALAPLPGEVRSAALEAAAGALESEMTAILDANAKDVAGGEKLVADGEMGEPLLKRLVLTEEDAAANPQGCAQLRRLFEFQVWKSRRPILVEKLPINNFRTGLLSAIFPDYLEEMAPSLGVGIGLAMRTVDDR